MYNLYFMCQKYFTTKLLSNVLILSEWWMLFLYYSIKVFVTKSLSGCVIFKNAAFSLRCVSLWKVKARGIPNLSDWDHCIALFCGWELW